MSAVKHKRKLQRTHQKVVGRLPAIDGRRGKPKCWDESWRLESATLPALEARLAQIKSPTLEARK